ncbi:LysR family transcriptional regulator [Paraburkholderia fungorum]|uniref:LysR family transcriptional regulator n=1 Tax=Paraburkholderia fungorum TaxID=134537 RepID=UPI0038BCD88E
MIDALNTFLAVVAQGSFSSVAKTQDLAVSSVARKIDWLESEFGAQLFNRSTRVLRLTDAGEAFVPRARVILDELAEAKEVLSSSHAEPRGVVRITAPSAFGRRHIAPAAAAFLRAFPSLEADVHLSDTIVDFASERFDVAIRIGVLPDSDLVAARLAPQHRVACASPDYVSRHGLPARPEDLLQHNCLTVRSTPHRVGWWCFDGVNDGRPLPVRGTLRSDDSDVLLHAALAGSGIAHLATWLVADDIAAGRLLKMFPVDTPAENVATSAIHAVRMPGRGEQRARLFIEFLRRHLEVADGGAPRWDRVIARARSASGDD